ncbi:beta-lactamase regulator AmpE [Aestuariibacter salexigens]|uniref:beta-lactamase regulator AmpE n=1 Tax=Aestuariibacter salexigens TaxID=226010 RepID=UPI000421FC30|nr:beta-lactamase regulator AmpE [Aestuariibacter salexigens]
MTLISLLIVLSIERVTPKNLYWRDSYYFNLFKQQIQHREWLDEDASFWLLLVLIVLPSILLSLLLGSLGWFLDFVIATLVLMVCIGCHDLRATYKCFLQAANRGDLEACSLYAQQMGHGQDADISLPSEARQTGSFGQKLVWLNYQHYAAPMIWFVVFGAPGVVFYVVARNMQNWLAQTQHPLQDSLDKLMAVIDWLPIRITALGFLLVGHFSRALPIWLGYLPDPSISARQLIAEVSRAAEETEDDDFDPTEEPRALVKLAKRNMTFLLVLVSVLTLSGTLA